MKQKLKTWLGRRLGVFRTKKDKDHHVPGHVAHMHLKQHRKGNR